MNDWTGGYVSDVEYVPGFYAEQAPGVIDLACIMAGYEPVRRPGSSAPFTYCDLGCGHAGTVAALAAANPAGRFWGIDLMPAHIARAEDFRREAGIDNLTLVEADVAALAEAADPGLPQFDYIALHGLFSWVSDEVRAGIVRFLGRFLRPGGAVYVGYNVLPGWTDVIPTQKVLYEYARIQTGSSVERVSAGIGFLRQMMAAGAHGLDSCMQERLFADITIPETLQRHRRYLAHEFLNGQWKPRFHLDVARELAAAKLEFAASANLMENFDGIGLTPEARALLETVPAGPLRETIEDFFNVRRFRRDLFVRGRREITAPMRESMLSEVALALRGLRPEPDQREWPMLNMEFQLNRDVYGPVFDRLEHGPATVAELRETVRGAGAEVTGNELVGLLSGLELVLPVLHDVPAEALGSCFRHNRVVLREAFRSVRQNLFHLATPVGHTALEFNTFQTLMLDGMFGGIAPAVEPLTDFVIQRAGIDPDILQEVTERDASVGAAGPDGLPQAAGDGTDAAARGRTVQRRAGDIVHDVIEHALTKRVPGWRQLGILPPERDA